jgi:ferredoxin-nitrate reductase
MTDIFKSTCSYCGVGCGIEILRETSGELSLRGDESHPANRGQLCSKGRSLLHTVRSTDTRLRYPTMRPSKFARRERATWDAAIARIAGEFRRIISQHGPDAVAFYVSGQCLTEEYYLANKIAKGFLKTNNIDTNSRLCMSSAVAGYKATLGADAVPTCYEDIDFADTFLLAGANPAWAHPILFRRIEARKAAAPGTQIVVIDPRKTATAHAADLHLQLIPGTDVALFLAFARRLIHTKQIDPRFIADRTDGFERFAEAADHWTLSRAAQTCGLDESDIARAADLLGGANRFLSMWTMGLNQSAAGTDKNISLINLSLITGKIGKPGCGPFSLTGQPNAMGGREVGGMANLLPAHRNLADPRHRAEVARFWGVDSLPDKPGLTAVELFDAIGAGKVKAVWIIATNPLSSLPNVRAAEAALHKADLVVVQDIYPSETTQHADILLPAAGWLEKTGAMTNADRRIALLEKAVEPPGEALPDTEILQKFAHAMGWQKQFNYESPADIFEEHARLTAGTDCDITGLSHNVLRSQGPTQWPAPRPDTPVNLLKNRKLKMENSPSPRLYTDGRFATASRRAQIPTVHYQDRSEHASDTLPLLLTTGRIRDQWHTMTKTGKVNKLAQHHPAPFCEIHPVDAAARGMKDGDMLVVKNSRGEVRVAARITTDIRAGVLFLPMHWGRQLIAHVPRGGDSARANNLTSPRLDPVSKEPDLKLAAVQAERFAPKKRRIVIVGAGAAALAFIEHHRRFNQEDELLLLGGENFPVYNRVLLPHYIDGSADWDALVRADRSSLNPHRVRFYPNTLVARIDRTHKTVTDTRGRSFEYDTLLLATGSRPTIHYDGPMPARGIHTLRSRHDADAILADALPGKHAVIHGAGLLALELADALTRRGLHVTLLQRSDRLMSKQLDPTASALLTEELRARNIEVLFHTTPIELVGTDKLTAVRTTTQPSVLSPQHFSSLPADIFIFATGTTPNKELAGTARLDCDKGILINHHLQTSDPAIFAIGECAQLDDYVPGTTPAAEAMARALAEFLRGNDHAPFRPTPSANILKIHGLSLAAAGATDPSPDDPALPANEIETVTLLDSRHRFYQKCVIHKDRLIGAICMGDTQNFSQYLEWIAAGTELEDLRRTLLRPGAGAAPPLDGPLICSCHHVGAGTITSAAADNHYSLPQVCAATRAGTGCGSCKPEIARLIKQCQPAPQEPAPALTPA